MTEGKKFQRTKERKHERTKARKNDRREEVSKNERTNERNNAKRNKKEVSPVLPQIVALAESYILVFQRTDVEADGTFQAAEIGEEPEHVPPTSQCPAPPRFFAFRAAASGWAQL